MHVGIIAFPVAIQALASVPFFVIDLQHCQVINQAQKSAMQTFQTFVISG
jgi:hypothetical protein